MNDSESERGDNVGGNVDAQHDLVEVGAWMRIERGFRNWSQSELATRSGCSRQYIAAIEHGAVHPNGKPINVKYDVIAAIAAAFSVKEKIEIIRVVSGRYQIRVKPSEATTKSADHSTSNDMTEIVERLQRLEQMIVAVSRSVERIEDSMRWRDDDPRGAWKPMDFTRPATKRDKPDLYYTIIHPTTKAEVLPPSNRVWRVTSKRYDELECDGRIWWGKYGENRYPQLKRFADAVENELNSE